MRNAISVVAIGAILAASAAQAGNSAPFPLDTRTGIRPARAAEPLAYSTDWNGSEGCSILIDGTPLLSNATGTGDYVWNAAAEPRGLHTCTFDDGVETLTAAFGVGRGILEVVCPYAGCEPAAGTNEYEWGSTVTASAPADYVDGLERSACTGWTGTGSVPASGTGSSVTFPITEDSTLTWLWKTSSVRMDASGVGPLWSEPAEGDSWLPVAGGGFRSAEVGAGESSVLEVAVSGAGLLSFRWKISANRGDWCRFLADGVETGAITRVADWATVTQELGAGDHTLRWSFEKSASAAANDNAAYLADVCWRPYVALAVASGDGTPTPAAGTYRHLYGDPVALSVAEPEPTGGTRRICTGWTGTGNVPASGASNSVDVVLTEDSAIAWNWKTNVWLSLSCAGPLVAGFDSGWLDFGTTLVIAYEPLVPHFGLALTGDTEGVAWDREAQTLAVPTDRPRSLTLTVSPLTLATALDAPGLVWTTDAAIPWTPTMDAALAADGVDLARCAAVPSGGESALATTLSGPGTLAWSWKLEAAAGLHGIDVELDGVYADSLAVADVWESASLAITGAGEHVVRFVFWNADLVDGTTADAACLDQVSWTGTVPETPMGDAFTTTSEVPIAHEWLDRFGLVRNGNYEAAANGTAANGLPVWKCYVADLNPTDPAARFLANIALEGERVVVTWNPDSDERVYVVEGRETLDDVAGWTSPTNAASRFFRVKVSLPAGHGVGGGAATGFTPVTLTFDANGGTVDPTTIRYTADGMLGALPTAIGNGTFYGWYSKPEGGVRFTAETPVPKKDMTLYARWTPTYTVKFNANGGSGTMANQSFTSGIAQALPANAFTRTSYTFAGWATSASGEKVYNDKQSVLNLASGDGATVNLYAKWSPISYTVTFNANGGTGTMADQGFTYGTAQALMANVFTRTGYTFAGWATSASGAKVYDNGQSVLNLATTAGMTVNLYAKWNPISYAVKFNANGGSGTMANQGFTYGTAQTLTANAFTRPGYVFTGWTTSASGAKVYDDKQSVLNLAAVEGATVNLHAVWITIAESHGKVQLWEGGPYWAETNIGAENPWDCGLCFWWGDTVGYQREGDAWVASDGSSRNFSFNEGNTPTYNKDPSTLRSEGWTTSAGVLAPAHDAAHVHWGGNWRMPTKDELSALDNNCDWTWTTRNGVKGFVVQGRGNYASASIFLPDADGIYWSSVPYSVTSSYSWCLFFTSGYLEETYCPRYRGLPVRPVQGFMSYFSYTVQFHANGGAGTMADQTFTCGTAQTLTANSFTRTGCTFAGWATSASGAKVYDDGQSVLNLAAVDGETVNLYAVWIQNTVQPVVDTDWFVSASTGNDSFTGRSWNSAKRTIQAAIDAASAGDTILVADGTYEPIASDNKAIVIRSVSGAERTIIDGGSSNCCAWLTYSDVSSNGDDHQDTTLEGFTLQNGRSVGAGGAYGGTIRNCIIRNGRCDQGGGSNPSGANLGGGARLSRLYNCLIEDCYHNGVVHSKTYNCTIINNGNYGCWDGYAYNCIVFGHSRMEFNCMSTADRTPNCVTDNPGFVDVANGDYHLSATSPCIDAGDNAYASPSDTDLDGNPRIGNGVVDIGCYESGSQSPITYTVKFNANGGTGTMADQGFTYGTAQNLTANAFTRTGYIFAGWATSASGAKVYDDRQSVSNLATTAGATVNLYAVWIIVSEDHGKVQLWEGGPYWATTNIGAEDPEDFGLYFWWGDTVGYRRENDAWVASDGSSQDFWFYENPISQQTSVKNPSTLLSEGWIVSKDGTYVLAPAHDAAHVHWGGNWRMPTKDDFFALYDNCDWTWTTRNGVEGYVVRGRDAYFSASIFLPAAGYGSSGSSLDDVGSNGDYWSSVPSSGNTYSWVLRLNSESHGMDYFGDRDVGLPIRPVQEFTE